MACSGSAASEKRFCLCAAIRRHPGSERQEVSAREPGLEHSRSLHLPETHFCRVEGVRISEIPEQLHQLLHLMCCLLNRDKHDQEFVQPRGEQCL